MIREQEYHAIQYFHKETRLRLADGRECKIQDIRVGDMLRSASGEIQRVVNIVKGYEEKLVRVKLKNNKYCMVVVDTEFYTDKGIVNLEKLQKGDNVLLQAGHEVVPIVSIEKISYNDSVYGLFLEDTTELLSNGFVIGEDETAKLQAEKDYLEKELEIILKRKQEVDEKLKKMQCE